MTYEFSITIGNDRIKVFIPSDYKYFRQACTRLHSNKYTEFHIVSTSVNFCCGKEIFNIDEQSVFAVPANIPHHYVTEEEINYFSFQVDIPCDTFVCKKIDSNLLSLFLRELSQSEVSYPKITSLISYIVYALLGEDKWTNIENTDYKLLISEFFAMRYAENVNIHDLAEILCLSEKQTQRLVIKHTGNTFKKELISTRMAVAKHLTDVKGKSLKDAAYYVGYQSYSGFWKAYVDFYGKKPSE